MENMPWKILKKHISCLKVSRGKSVDMWCKAWIFFFFFFFSSLFSIVAEPYVRDYRYIECNRLGLGCILTLMFRSQLTVDDLCLQQNTIGAPHTTIQHPWGIQQACQAYHKGRSQLAFFWSFFISFFSHSHDSHYFSLLFSKGLQGS